MTFFVNRIDGTRIGEFNEAEFREKVFARKIAANDYYWHDGMADWRPVSEYRALAKTQRISFAPPPRPTIKIDMEAAAKSDMKSRARPQNFISRLLQRIKDRK